MQEEDNYVKREGNYVRRDNYIREGGAGDYVRRERNHLPGTARGLIGFSGTGAFRNDYKFFQKYT